MKFIVDSLGRREKEKQGNLQDWIKNLTNSHILKPEKLAFMLPVTYQTQ